MNNKLTKKQKQIIDFIVNFTEENNYSPSYREIMAGLGLSSVSAVAEHVENLVEKGALKKTPGAARSLEVIDLSHGVSLEHIMPQSLSPEWEHDLGSDYNNIYNKYLSNLGNLTLTGYNSEYSNYPFAKKKSMENAE